MTLTGSEFVYLLQQHIQSHLSIVLTKMSSTDFMLEVNDKELIIGSILIGLGV